MVEWSWLLIVYERLPPTRSRGETYEVQHAIAWGSWHVLDICSSNLVSMYVCVCRHYRGEVSGFSELFARCPNGTASLRLIEDALVLEN